MFKNVYFYRARLFPAVLTSFPLLIFINKILTIQYHDALKNIFDVLPFLLHLGLSAAIIFLCVQVNRVISKELFQRLYYKGELHMPTTTHLLWKSTAYDKSIKKHLREKMSEKFRIHLLTPEEEQQDEIRARNLIVTCIGQARVLLKDNKMLLQHNIEYGFWRNLIGGSLLAVLFSIVIIVYSSTMNEMALKTTGMILLLLYSIPLVISKWIIRNYGNYYSKILFEQFLSL